MSTILCRPCETTTTTTLTLKLAAPPATPPPSAIDLSFLQSVSSTTTYSTKLSAKSLELCTENLGSETGSEMMIMTDDDITTLFTSSRKKPNRPVRKSSDRRRNTTSFPPPITTINTLQVRRQSREGGRLVIEAVETANPVLQAERSNGRLRLCFSRTEEEEVIESESESESEREIKIEETKKVEVEKFEMARRCSSNQQANWRKPASLWVAASS